jgi:hypothetical protein
MQFVTGALAKELGSSASGAVLARLFEGLGNLKKNAVSWQTDQDAVAGVREQRRERSLMLQSGWRSFVRATFIMGASSAFLDLAVANQQDLNTPNLALAEIAGVFARQTGRLLGSRPDRTGRTRIAACAASRTGRRCLAIGLLLWRRSACISTGPIRSLEIGADGTILNR